ncbi:MAG: tyrosine-type recombinase/integrase [Clostridiales bacterium]|nr:tyrosine-type recombinase/integrase [Clostridiales bacterium]MCF8023131.1 tyrosine-type recombinase/integrase [Clostridiales bacterium]
MNYVQPIKDTQKLEIIKKILKADSLRNYCFFVLGINCGIRISELLKLTIKDVSDKNGKIKDKITITNNKGKTKEFPLGVQGKKALKEYIKKTEMSDESPLFPSKKGNKPITRVQAYRIINNAALHAGITEEIGTHTLRKTFGYHAYKNGTDIKFLQKLFNHSSVEITLQYIGVSQGEYDPFYMVFDI